MYYQLFTRTAKNQPWEIEFGDSDKECVIFERDDWTERPGNKKVNAKIVSFSRVPTTNQLMAKLAELNEVKA